MSDRTTSSIDQLQARIQELEAQLADCQAQNAHLRTSEAKFRAIANHASDTICTINQAGAITYISPNVQAEIGYTPAELEGQVFTPLIHPDDLSHCAAVIEQVMTTAQPYNGLEYRVRHQQGHYVWHRANLSTYQDASGQPVLIAIGRDATQQKETEAALAKSQAQFETILQNANVAIFAKDLEGRYIFANPWVSQEVGLPLAQILGKTDADLLPAEVAEQLRVGDLTALETGQAIRSEETIVSPQGEHTYLAIKFPLMDADGRPYAVCGISTNITDLKRTEAALRASEARLNRILDRTSACIADYRNYTDRTFIPDYFSSGSLQLWGFTPEELLADLQIWISRFELEDLQAILAEAHDYIFDEQPYRYEYRYHHPDGSLRWIELNLNSYRDEIEDCWRTTVISTDITDRKLAEAALRESEAKLNRILDGTSACIADYRVYPDQRFIADYFSSGSQQLWGFAPEEILADMQLYISRYEPADLQIILEEAFDCIFSESPYTSEYRYHHPDGSLRWIQFSLTSFWDEAEGCWRTPTVSIDITDRKLAEAALRESETRLNQILDSALASIARYRIYADYNWEPEYFSSGTTEIWGFTPEEILENKMRQFERVHPDDMEAIIRSQVYPAIFAEQTARFEYRYHHPKKQEWRWIALTVSSVRDESADCWLATVIATDVSDRKRLEEELRQSETKFRRIVENANDLVATATSDGTLTYISPNVSNLLGYTNTELIGGYFAPIVHPDDVQLAIHAIQEVMTTGTNYEYETRLVHRDGSLRYVISNVSMYEGEDGNPMLLSFARDITDRKRLEEELRKSETKFRRIVENASDLITTVTPDGIITYISPNSYEQMGYRDLELIGQHFSMVVYPEDLAAAAKVITQVLATEEAHTLSHRIIHQDGSIRYMVANVALFQDEEGNLSLLGISRDVTQQKRLEEELRQSETKFRRIVENASDLIATATPDGNVTYLSPATLNLLGYTNEELIGQHFDRLIHPDDLSVTADAIAQVMTTGESCTFDHRLIHRDGSLRYVVANLSIYDDENGNPVLLGISRDITERRQLEEELRRSEAKFRRIVENANDTIATITPEGIITYLSPNMLKMIGREATEVIGTSFEPLVHPDDLPMIGSLLQEGFTTGKPFTTEYRLRDRDGNYRYLVANSSVYYDENSNPMVLGISRDVTKQKRLEEELRQSEYKFRAIVENANDLIYVIDANGRILYMSPNSAAINGFNPEEMEGRTFDRFVHPDDLVVGADAIGRAIAGEKFSFELRSFHKDGSIRWFSSNISPFSLADGTRVMMGIGRDTTERKQREEELRLAKDAAEAANRSKSTFLANMSHELRTPLNVILGYTQLMERENALSDRQRNFITTINRSGEHLLNLINDVLEMSKIEAGRITLNPEPFDLRHLLDTLQSMFRIRTEAKKLSLNFHVPSNLPTTILTDEGKLRQVLINLLSNAVKFTEQGSITLHVEMINTVTSHQTSDLTAEANPTPHSPTILFTITDTGIGIAPTEIEQLFQPFVQTASGLRVKEGTGLGLTISRQFVQLMGGEIQVQSLVGQGSTFTFQIPVTLTERTVAPAPTRRSQPVLGLLPGQPTYRLLIVDDRVDNRNLLTHLLQPLGFVTQTANNGQEAITLWRTWQPDLIWMDMRMPVMNGYEATRQIRALEQNQTSDASQDIQTPRLTKIIALTASAFEEQRATILAAGCDDFVRKPFREHLIFDKLTEHLGVQFVYAEPVEEPDWRMAEPADLLPDSFAVMSPEWIEAFRQAAIAIDSDRLLQLVVEIPPDHANLANQLRDLINRFNFDEILELIGDTCDA